MKSRETFEALASELTPDLIAILERAYDVGFRDALANTPGLAEYVKEPQPNVSPDALVEAVGESAIVGFPDSFLSFDEEDDDDEEDDVSDTDAPTTEKREPKRGRQRGIRSSTTVGKLRENIETIFKLDRFNIQIVVCERGDPNRRQLRADVRIGKYLLEPQ